MPKDVRDIPELLKNEASGLQYEIVRDLGNFTVALLAISNAPERVNLIGTGSLVTFKGSHFVLTARHVWDDGLKDSDQVGITLKPDVTHRHGITTRDIAVFGLPKPVKWNEWGPDLMLLRIPPEHIGAINAYKVFLNVEKPDKKVEREVFWVQVLMGAPGAFSKVTGPHVDLQINGMFLGPEKAQEHEGLDYLDYEMDLKFPVPRNFGGVSGGGVWEVNLYYDVKSDKVVWTSSLHGVAFYQLPIVDEHRPIRCHGPNSIRAVLATFV